MFYSYLTLEEEAVILPEILSGNMGGFDTNNEYVAEYRKLADKITAEYKNEMYNVYTLHIKPIMIETMGIIVKDIEFILNKNGHTSYVAYQTAVNPPENSYKIGNVPDYKFHAVYSRVFGKQAYASKLATMGLIKYIKSISPDIVHFHNLHSNYVNLNMLCDYLAKSKIPVVITMHDCWFFTGKCTHYAAVKCDKWQSTCGNCPQNKNEQASLFLDCTQKVLKDKTEHLNKLHNLTLVGCSEWIANEAKKSLLKNADIQVAYNGVDTSIFTPHKNDFKEKYNLKKNFTILGFANKWCLDINKDATEKIIQHNTDADVVIVDTAENTTVIAPTHNIFPESSLAAGNNTPVIGNAKTLNPTAAGIQRNIVS